MIARLVRAALQAPAVVFALACAVAGAGVFAFGRLDIEAYPNPVAPMIEIIAQPEGWSAEEVERAVTIPLETGLNGIIDLDHVRSQSLFGLADVKCYFSWNVDYYTAQQRVLNRLAFIELPASVKPSLSPWSAIGEVYRYKLVGKGYSLAQLKTTEDWVLEKQFKQVPGVIDVVSFGGETKQYHVEVDPVRLRAQGVTLVQVQNAVGNANQNVGGQRISIGEQSYNIRGIGLIKNLRDIDEIVVAQNKGVPVRLKDVAETTIGAAPRLGVVGEDEASDIVQGIVLMRYGGDSSKTLEGLKARIAFIRENHLLPPGMELVTLYDRGSLVHVTTHTVLENVVEGMLLVTLVLWVFLGRGKAALITAVNLPLALAIAFVGMVGTDTPANLISLGAVDFGIVADSTVIMMENIFRRLGAGGTGAAVERIGAAAAEVGGPMFSSTLIIAVAFIPLFTMSGVAGVIFSPMAHTYAFAIGGAIVLALSLTPVLALRFMPVERAPEGHLPKELEESDEGENAVMRALDRLYRPLFAFALRRRGLALALVLVPVSLALLAGAFLGREFMPKLEEGNFWIRATMPMSISLEQSSQYVGRMRAILLGCPGQSLEGCTDQNRSRPEVRTVISQLGRPDDGTDVSGFHNIEFLAPLEEASRWRKGITKDGMTGELSGELEDAFPGVVFNFSQYIADNVEEAMSGVKGENSVKVVGPDLQVDSRKAEEIVQVMSKVRGVEDLGIFKSLGQPSIRITPDRMLAGRYGLNVGDVEAVIQAAVGGTAITQVYEGEKHFDLTVRWKPRFRKDVEAIKAILVTAADGTQVPLGQVSEVVPEEGPSVIYREDNRRYVPVKFSVRGRDLASTIEESQARLREALKLPYDTHLEWAGEMSQLKDTTQRLLIVMPLTLLLIAFIVFTAVKTWRDTAIVLLGIPVACSGGVAALFVTGTHFSISAAMGFISIFGIAIQDALLVVTYAQRLWERGASVEAGARLAAERRLRPVLMTISVAMLGLLPAAVSRGIGSETQKPLAIVVIGGALVLAVAPRLLQPALLVLAHRKDRPRPQEPSAPPSLEPASP